MSDVAIKAIYASVVEDEGQLFIGFAAGEEADEPYILFRQAVEGGPIWFEVSDETLGADDAIELVRRDAKGLTLLVRPEKVAKIGWAREISVKLHEKTENAEEAVAALREMLGPIFEA